MLALLERLRKLGVEGDRLRGDHDRGQCAGLQALGERVPSLTIYCGCIDPELDAQRRVRPGFGDAARRLYGSVAGSP